MTKKILKVFDDVYFNLEDWKDWIEELIAEYGKDAYFYASAMEEEDPFAMEEEDPLYNPEIEYIVEK